LKPQARPRLNERNSAVGAEIVDTAGGVVTVRITGRLTYAELCAVQKQGAEILRQQGRMGILVLGQGFQGWDPEGDWGDISFQLENDQFIAKQAIVGETRWQELALIFAGKGLRQPPVEYFQPADLAKARAWLTEPA
jgi:hypothetical protein